MSRHVCIEAVTPADAAAIAEQLRTAPRADATVQSMGPRAAVSPQVRRADRLTAPPSIAFSMRSAIDGLRGRLESHFGIALGALEELQFLRYGAGGHFVAHQDGNTGLTRDASSGRRISVVLFLNGQSQGNRIGAFEGGSLILYGNGRTDDDRDLRIAPCAGLLVAFPAEATHEVQPVVSGERFSIAGWFRAPGT